MLLADHFVERFRAQAFGERRVAGLIEWQRQRAHRARR
jgi:hypothetical protein